MSIPSPEELDIPASAYREMIIDRVELYLLDHGPIQRTRFYADFSDVRMEDLERYMNVLERRGAVLRYKQGGRWTLALSEDEKKEISQPYRRITPDQQRELLATVWDKNKLLYKSQENSRRKAKEISSQDVTMGKDDSCDIRGLHGTYHTTLKTCECDDFVYNKKAGAPCKHIYRLAAELLARRQQSEAVPAPDKLSAEPTKTSQKQDKPVKKDTKPKQPSPADQKATVKPSTPAEPDKVPYQISADPAEQAAQPPADTPRPVQALVQDIQTLCAAFCTASPEKRSMLLALASVPESSIPVLSIILKSILPMP